MAGWLLFSYKVPTEPSARRVYVWRKLKGLGAILLHDTVWVLPHTPQSLENLQWLATDVCDMEGGSAMLWEAEQVFTGQTDKLEDQFVAQVDAQYREMLAALDQPEPDLPALAKRFQQVQRQDYFRSPLGEQVRVRLIEERGPDRK